MKSHILLLLLVAVPVCAQHVLEGKTPLQIAKENQYQDAIDILQQLGASR